MAVVGHSLAAGIAPIVAAGTGALVVYLCPAPTGPFADVDVDIAPVRRTFPLPPTDEHGASVWDAEVAVETMYARLPRDIARAVAERLRPGSSAPDRYQPGRHPDPPGRLILATEDEFFDPEWSRRVASAVLATEPIEITAGHFPMLERPAELARLLDGSRISPAQPPIGRFVTGSLGSLDWGSCALPGAAAFPATRQPLATSSDTAFAW